MMGRKTPIDWGGADDGLATPPASAKAMPPLSLKALKLLSVYWLARNCRSALCWSPDTRPMSPRWCQCQTTTAWKHLGTAGWSRYRDRCSPIAALALSEVS